MNQKTYNKTVGWIFAVIAVLHLLRIIKGWEAIIGGVTISVWASALALFASGYLAYRGLSLSKS